MKKALSKSMAWLLSVVMVFGVFTVSSVSVYAYDARTIVDLVNSKVGTSYANGYCLAFVREMFQQAYGYSSTAPCAYEYGNSFIDSNSRYDIPLGADVFFGGSDVQCGNHKAGHIGIYVGDDCIVHAWAGKVTRSTIDYVTRCGYPYRGWGWHADIPLDTDIFYNPQGCVDLVESTEPGKIHVRGWAFDRDDVNANIEVHVYVGGIPGSGAPGYGIVANTERPDVNNVYSVGNYHGFDHVIDVSPTGSQTAYLYAINIGGGNNVEIGRKTVNISPKPSDSTCPVITDIYTHSYDSNGYTLHFIVNDDTALSYVRVYTQGSVPQTSEDISVAGTGWEINYRVNYSDHDNVKKGYTHAIWAFDTAGNRGDSDWIYVPYDDVAPTISDVTVSQVTSKGYRVTCKVNDNTGVTGVSFPTWTVNGGQDDLIWHEGSVNGNIATYYVETSTHNNETGEYITHIYASDAAGNYHSVSTGGIIVKDEPQEAAYTVYEGHKYVVYNSGKTWTEAKQWCEQNGGHLATVTTENEWNAVKTLLKSYNGTFCWLGADDNSGTWKWLTGETVDYNVWGNNQPDNCGNSEHYLGTWGGWYVDGYVWNDYRNNPDEVGGFVFEKDITPSNTGELNGHTYEYYSDTMSWWQAYRRCEKNGGHLVTITSKEENDFVVSLAGDSSYLWTGGRTKDKNTWLWITGESFGYQNWSEGEPNDTDGKEDALEIYLPKTGHNGEWNDTDSSHCSAFICEYDNTIDASKYIPAYKENYNGHEYWFFEDIVDWRTAKKICEAKGGYLTIPNNADENAFILSGVKKTSKTQTWIGATDIAEEGIWRDSKGDLLKYTNWHPAQPDNWNGSVCEDYALMWPEGVWNDSNSYVGFSDDIGFVCEFDDLCTGSGHSYTTEIIDPTCTEQGYTLHTCSKCGDSYKDTYTDKLNHEYGEWTITGDKAVRKCKHCGAEETKPLAASITLDRASVSIEKGKTLTLKAVVVPDNAYSKSVSWTTTDNNIVTVSDGTVTAKGVGTAAITASTSNGKTATCIVTVTNPTVAVTGISLNKTSAAINKGSSITLTATVTPSDATDKTVTWTTSNSSVATVSNGTVTAKAVGTATITAKTSNGKTATCTVTVTDSSSVIVPTGITLNKTSATLSKGDVINIYATILPANASDKTVTWSSSNTSVATVSKGNITAKSAGTTTITAKTSNGKTATCTVTVTDSSSVIIPTGITLNKTSATLSKGDTINIYATVLPANASDKTVTWSSSNTSVATVSKGNITAKSAGTTTITAKTSNGLTATCTVTVKGAAISQLNNTSVVNSDIVQVGDKIRVAPSANGGSGQYSSAVYYKRSTASTWKTLGKEFGNTFTQSNSTVALQPTSEGTFNIKVVIKDTNGATAEQYFTVDVVKELELTNISVMGRFVVNLGTAIPMIGKAVGGSAPYTYSFYFKRSTNTNWKLLGEKFQTTASARFKPTATGTYDIRIDVKDSNGTIVKKFFTATVK